MKTRKDESTDQSADDIHSTVRVRIEGLLSVGDGLFELADVQPRFPNWGLVRQGLGFEGNKSTPDEDFLFDQISDLLWQHDITTILRGRIQRA